MTNGFDMECEAKWLVHGMEDLASNWLHFPWSLTNWTLAPGTGMVERDLHKVLHSRLFCIYKEMQGISRPNFHFILSQKQYLHSFQYCWKCRLGIPTKASNISPILVQLFISQQWEVGEDKEDMGRQMATARTKRSHAMTGRTRRRWRECTPRRSGVQVSTGQRWLHHSRHGHEAAKNSNQPHGENNEKPEV